LRWGTVAEVVNFVSLYFEALSWAFEHERMTVGANPGACSIAAICSQWTKWSGSPKLHVLLQVTREFIRVIWEPANSEIDQFDKDYQVEGCFKTFSRPRRVLRLLMTIEALQKDPGKLESFHEVARAYHGADVVRKFFDQLLLFARESVLRNSGRYLSDVYPFGALADPDFAPFVFDAFCVWKSKSRRKNLSSEVARLVEALEENKHPSSFLLQLLADHNWEQISELMKVCKRDRAEFVRQIQSASEENFALFTLRSWLSALSHTRPVEKCFLDFDNQAKNSEGSTKNKAAEAMGKQLPTTTRSSRVQVANYIGQITKKVLQKSKPDKKRLRLEAKDDIIAATEQGFAGLNFTGNELQNADQDVAEIQEHYCQPRSGLSREMIAVFEALDSEKNWEGYQPPKYASSALRDQGKVLEIPLLANCSVNCLKRDVASKKGSPGKQVSCIKCLKRFHLKCMENEGVVDPGLKKADLVIFQFTCALCGGSSATNRIRDHSHIHIESDGSAKTTDRGDKTKKKTQNKKKK
jgi:hypothetical protein